jgi:hypothetical protein
MGFVVVLVALWGCASHHYGRTQVGDLSGAVIVEWRKPNLFWFKPDSSEPLIFARKSGDAIKPGAMLTDGGSIPRPFWVFKNFSPWGYGPAFIVHDWLFHMQDCKLPGHEKYTLEEAAMIMSEVMKTLMEGPDFDYGSKTAVYMMYKAVQTAPARAAWSNGVCITPGAPAFFGPPDEVFVVRAPRRSRR